MAKAIPGEAEISFFQHFRFRFCGDVCGCRSIPCKGSVCRRRKRQSLYYLLMRLMLWPDVVAGIGGSHDEREQTLNQLLVEMDGFGINEGIIVMAATNRVDVLDPAILRPGRFDRQVAVSAPDMRGREAILKVHARNKPLAEDVDLMQIAQTTARIYRRRVGEPFK